VWDSQAPILRGGGGGQSHLLYILGRDNVYTPTSGCDKVGTHYTAGE
jgi:hypothetical protein